MAILTKFGAVSAKCGFLRLFTLSTESYACNLHCSGGYPRLIDILWRSVKSFYQLKHSLFVRLSEPIQQLMLVLCQKVNVHNRTMDGKYKQAQSTASIKQTFSNHSVYILLGLFICLVCVVTATYGFHDHCSCQNVNLKGKLRDFLNVCFGRSIFNKPDMEH